MRRTDQPSHEDLVEAQIAIFRNQEAEMEAGVTEESDEYLRLHDVYYDLERRAVPFDRLGVWNEAFARHEEQTDGPVHPWLDWQSMPEDAWWRRRLGQAER